MWPIVVLQNAKYGSFVRLLPVSATTEWNVLDCGLGLSANQAAKLNQIANADISVVDHSVSKHPPLKVS
jgi:hypothetical protein